MTVKQIVGNNVGGGSPPSPLMGAHDTPVMLPEALADELDALTGRFADHIGEGLMAASVAIGLDVLGAMMQAEVTGLAGPKGRHNPDRTHVRHGAESESVVLGGRKVPVRRPRVRTANDESEAQLEVYEVAPR